MVFMNRGFTERISGHEHSSLYYFSNELIRFGYRTGSGVFFRKAIVKFSVII